MKKQILAALMLTALSAPTLTHPIAFKTAFDMGIFLCNLVMTPTVLDSWGIPLSSILRRKPNYHFQIEVAPLIKNVGTIAHLGLYFYTLSGLWKAYKERNNGGKIQVKK